MNHVPMSSTRPAPQMAIHVRRSGDAGTPVLLLHGIGGSSASFRPQLDALAKEHRVSAWDAPGYGSSADAEAPPGIEGYAATAATLLEETGPAHVVGVSWGGVIATRMALDHPRLLRSLTLADSTRGSGRTREGAARMRARAAELAELGPAEFARRRGPRLPGPDAGPALRETLVQTMAGVRLPGYRFAAESMAQTDHSELLGRVGAPTMVLVGARDRITGVDESRLLAATIPGARFVLIPCAGHAANQEQPDAVNRELFEFFSEVDTAAGGRR